MAASETKTKHTPGPWEVTDHFSDFFNVEGPVGNDDVDPFAVEVVWVVARVWADAPVLRDAAEANARLIAAAPEMLAALEAFGFTMPSNDAPCHAGICEQSDCGNCQRIASALAAISKATGGAHA